jgi:glycogen(starch) synthase
VRVLFWAERFWPYVGGIEVLTARLVPALRDRGHDITVVTSLEGRDLPPRGHYRGVPIHRVPFRTALTAGGMDRFRGVKHEVARLKDTVQPDLVHINTMGPSLVFHLETSSTSAAPPVLFTLHNHLAATIDPRRTALGKLLGTAAWVTAVSSAALAEARAAIPAIAPRSSVIYNGVIPPVAIAAPLPFDPPRLLCLGRLLPQKGFDLALRALAVLRPRWPEARLLVAGDGPARADLEQGAAALGLRDAVEFAGWVAPHEVAALLNAAAVVLMPSRWEGLPLVALEAALMARPVVATRVGGLPEVILHGETGLLVDAEDGAALAAAIEELLANPQRATRLGEAAQVRAAEVFGWERCVDAYDALYRRLSHAPAGVQPTPTPLFTSSAVPRGTA